MCQALFRFCPFPSRVSTIYAFLCISYAQFCTHALTVASLDLLLQGQRTQLNLYEDRFHKLFQDAMGNHSGMVGMGLLAGNGMITTLPLCEVESFTRFGTDENWVDKGDGMGNGSIFVTIRAVGRCKIISDDGMLQEEPYFKATVCELLDEDLALEGLKEKGNTELSGVSSPIEIASTIANNIENEMVSIANLEHKLKELESKSTSSSTAAVDDETRNVEDKTADGKDEVMNRRLVNAQLENLFMQSDSSTEGVDIETEAKANNDELEEDDDDEEDDELLEEDVDESKIDDRVAQFQKAFEDAKETDTFGYVLQTINVNDKSTIRTPKDLTAISWASFCTGQADNIQREVMKIQALDETNVLKRLQLAAAMLREEKKVLRAKLSLAGVQDSSSNEQEES